MNRTILVLFVFLSFGTDAKAATEAEYDFESPYNNQYVVVDVDKSDITENSVIRLTMDVQFENHGNSAFLNGIPDELNPNSTRTQQENSGYLIIIKLPIAENWRQNGKRLKVKISADTDFPNRPPYNTNLPISRP